MPANWKREFACLNCGHPVPSDGSACCSAPLAGPIMVHWARRLGCAPDRDYNRLMTVAIKHGPRTAFWYRALLFPHVAYGDVDNYEDGAKLCEGFLSIVRA